MVFRREGCVDQAGGGVGGDVNAGLGGRRTGAEPRSPERETYHTRSGERGSPLILHFQNSTGKRLSLQPSETYHV